MKAGDKIIYYVTGLKAFGAISTIASPYFESHETIWQSGDPKKAAPGTIRADFAQSIDANAVHGSDGPDTAQVEIAYFFPSSQVYSR